MKTSKLILLFMAICLVTSACASGIIVADPIVPTDTKQPEFSVTDTVQSTPTIPAEAAIPTEDPSIELVFERNPVDSNMVKGVAPAVPLKLDESGNIVGLSPDVSQTWADNLKACYNAVIKKYPTSEIYLDVDVSSNSYVIIILMGGTVFYQTFKNQDGNYVYSNFPSSFENVDNQLELSGDYKPIKIPNTSLGVIWTDGIPQLLANYVELPNGDTYYTHYMDYSEAWSFGANPWKEVTGFQEILASFPPIEMDIEPIYTQTTEYEYMGVKINAELVIDESSAPGISKMSVPDNVLAEFIARTFFGVWWDRYKKETDNSPTEYDFVNFMKLWSEAQRYDDYEYWKKIQIDSVWANNLSDGFGYIQKPYDILLMCSGEAPEGVYAIDKVSIVFTGEGNEFNVTSVVKADILASGMGTNIGGKTIFMFFYSFIRQTVFANKLLLSEEYSIELAFEKWYLINNRGESIMERKRSNNDNKLYRLLYFGGLAVQ